VGIRDWPAAVKPPLAASRIDREAQRDFLPRLRPQGAAHGPFEFPPRAFTVAPPRRAAEEALRAFLFAGAAVFAIAGVWFIGREFRVAFTPTTATTGSSSEAAAHAGYPRSATLPGGVQFELPAPARRIVATTARAVEFLADLCEPERLVGFPDQALEYATLDAAMEAALAPATRFYAYAAEPVLRLAPDLVVADLWQSADTHGRLRASGVPLLILPELVGWDDVRTTLLALGTLLDRDAIASALVADGEARMAALAARGVPRQRAMVYSNFGAKGFSAGAGTSIHEIMVLAGLANVVAEDGGRGHLDMTFEQLLRIDPDVIIVSEPLAIPAAHTGDRGGASAALLLAEPSLAGLRAVRERRIVALPAGLFASNSHRMVRAAEVLATAVEALPAVGGSPVGSAPGR